MSLLEQASRALERASRQLPGQDVDQGPIETSFIRRLGFSASIASPSDLTENGGFSPDRQHCWVFQGNDVRLYQVSSGMQIKRWQFSVTPRVACQYLPFCGMDVVTRSSSTVKPEMG